MDYYSYLCATKGKCPEPEKISPIFIQGHRVMHLAIAGCLCVDMGCLAMILQVAQVVARFP